MLRLPFARATLVLSLIVGSTSSLVAQAAVYDQASWSLRFPDARSYRQAQTGCYGTASYRYTLPTVAYAQAYRERLAAFAADAGVSGAIFTSEDDRSGNHIIMDLATGDLDTVPVTGGSRHTALVFCVCRDEWVHKTDRAGVPNCASSTALPPLGATFVATRDDLTPAPADSWVDSVTGWTWTFASPAANWRSAQGLCGGAGSTLPDRPTLSHATRRIWSSVLGDKLRAADSGRAWTSDEFDFYSAMAGFLPSGDASAVSKRELLPVLCVSGI